MIPLCNDLLRLFVHYGKASVVYALASSTQKHSQLFATKHYIAESKRRLTVIRKSVSQGAHQTTTSWIPYLPNGLIEGIGHTIEEFRDGPAEYEIISYRNNVRHGLLIAYYITYFYTMTYVDGQRDGLESMTFYSGVDIRRIYWSKGEIKLHSD